MILYSVLFTVVIPPILTVLLEFPIIYFTKTCRNWVYIIAVNVLTNLILNITAMLIRLVSPDAAQIFIWVAEALLIPVSEALLYCKISSGKKWRIFLITYGANAFSYLMGLLLFNYLL